MRSFKFHSYFLKNFFQIFQRFEKFLLGNNHKQEKKNFTNELGSQTVFEGVMPFGHSPNANICKERIVLMPFLCYCNEQFCNRFMNSNANLSTIFNAPTNHDSWSA